MVFAFYIERLDDARPVAETGHRSERGIRGSLERYLSMGGGEYPCSG